MTVRSEVRTALLTVDGLTGVFADTAPPGTERPYAVVNDTLDESARMKGDTRTLWWRYLGQVDVWEDLATDDGSLAHAVREALDGLKMTWGMHLQVQSSLRVPDPDFTVSHRALTISVPTPGYTPVP